MDKTLKSRAVVVGYLTLTVPAIAAILLVPLQGLRMFGPFLFVYYLLAGIALGWQWYSVALPRWKQWLTGKGVQPEEVEYLARQTGIVWPIEAAIGPFAFHTTAAAVCGIHFGPWLLSRWYVWFLPLAGIARTPTANDYLRHFEMPSIAPAFLVGYLLSKYFQRLATFAWVLPTVVLIYELFTFAEPQASVLAPHSSTTGFEYFFVIQRTVPTFDFGDVDPIFSRVAQQMSVVAPFYAGLAYSAGAIAATHNLLKRIFGNSSGRQPEPDLTQMEKRPQGLD